MANIKRLITVALFLLICILLTFVTATAAANGDNDIAAAPAANGDNDTAAASAANGDNDTAAASAATGDTDAAESVSAAGMDIGAASKLNLLGLLRGVGALADGSPNLAVDRAPTRTEAVVMIVRLTGGEAEALSGNWTSPFYDVPEWAKPYISYAFAKNLIHGVGCEVFAGARDITVSEYITLVLRSLGYTSEDDFEWDKAWILSDKIGVTGGRYNAETGNFTRENAAEISFNALSAKLKGSDKLLCSLLIDEGVFAEEDAIALGVGVIDDSAVPLAVFPRKPEPEPEKAPATSELELKVLFLVNKEREKAGLATLIWQEELAAVARAHSKDMATRSYFNHINPEGQKPADRKRAAGLIFVYSAENIARGYKTAESVVAAWMNSPAHKSAILSEHAVKIGIGVHGDYWTMNLIG